MSGALSALIGTVGCGINLCTVIDVGGGVRRTGENGGGAIAPNIPFKSTTIAQAECIGTTLGFRIYIHGAIAQNFFSRLVVQDSVGVFRTLTSASATAYSLGNPGAGQPTGWDWSVAGGTSLVWPSAGGPYLLRLYP